MSTAQDVSKQKLKDLAEHTLNVAKELFRTQHKVLPVIVADIANGTAVVPLQFASPEEKRIVCAAATKALQRSKCERYVMVVEAFMKTVTEKEADNLSMPLSKDPSSKEVIIVVGADMYGANIMGSIETHDGILLEDTEQPVEFTTKTVDHLLPVFEKPPEEKPQ